MDGHGDIFRRNVLSRIVIRDLDQTLKNLKNINSVNKEN